MDLSHLNDDETQMGIIRLRAEVPQETAGLTDDEILAFAAVLYSSVSTVIYTMVGATEFMEPPVGQIAFKKFVQAFIPAYMPMLLRKGIISKVGIMAGRGVAEMVDKGASRAELFDS